MKNIYLLITVIIISGCDKKTLSNSNSAEFKGEKIDSFHIEKNKNGKIISKCSYRDGFQYGLCQFYFDNGQVKEEGNFFYGLPIDTFKFYNDKGFLKSIREYQIVKGEAVVNQYQFFDDNEKIIKNKSNYIILSAQKDTITLGEEYVLNIKLEAPRFNSKMDVVIGGFDAQYNLTDSTNYIVLKATDFEVQYRFSSTNLGENTVRGIVKDYKIIKNSDTIQARRNIYFTKKYFVSAQH